MRRVARRVVAVTLERHPQTAAELALLTRVLEEVFYLLDGLLAHGVSRGPRGPWCALA